MNKLRLYTQAVHLFLKGTLCYVIHDPLEYDISQRKPIFFLMKCEIVIQHDKQSVNDG